MKCTDIGHTSASFRQLAIGDCFQPQPSTEKSHTELGDPIYIKTVSANQVIDSSHGLALNLETGMLVNISLLQAVIIVSWITLTREN